MDKFDCISGNALQPKNTGEGNFEEPTGKATSAIGRLATLCDDPVGLTCSMYVARNCGLANEILPFDSFEAGVIAVKNGDADAVLVPGAYPKINTFIMDSGLRAARVFLMKIPPLVLACKLEQLGDRFKIIFHHPAVTPLLTEIEPHWECQVHASSNSEACRMLMATETPSACITNSFCAKHFNLQVFKILRDGISMPWTCFEKAKY